MRKYLIAAAVSGLLIMSLPLTGQAAEPVSKDSHDTLTLTFTGDILLDRGVRERLKNVPFHRLFDPLVDSLLLHSDIVVGNLECPATSIKEPVYKRFVFRGEPQGLDSLRLHGFTHLNLANNHAIDQGRRGLMDTHRNIIRAGMTPVGAGENADEAAAPVLLSEQPRQVWLLTSVLLPLENFASLPDKPGVSQSSVDSLTAQIRRLKSKNPNAYVIVTLHWGWEHHLKALPQQRIEAHRLIDAGADIIIGHHSHTLQTIETYHGRRIYYGIGNFIFDQRNPINTRACVVRLRIGRQGDSVETLPIDIKNCEAMPAAHAAWHCGI